MAAGNNAVSAGRLTLLGKALIVEDWFEKPAHKR
jgi:hypothetical protein